MEFLRRDSYNWELTVELIERAQLTNLFEGQVDSLKEITFLAPPSYSILRHLYDNNLEKVSELSQDECCQLVLKHVIKGKHLKEEIIFLKSRLPNLGYKTRRILRVYLCRR